ncbi:unnamed protein product [Brassica rapa subsp. narinosa]|uniref:(rape) hypothetical protein n=1 Tax=Brassica napus TaxID=3708 RepID=A0A816XIG5_BRANA|nr:unnamed protein product [Brassica napus]
MKHEHCGMGCDGFSWDKRCIKLGASHPRAAKFSLVVAVILSTVMGMTIAAVLLIFQDEYPVLFAEDEVVRNVVKELTPMLAFCIVINSLSCLAALAEERIREWGGIEEKENLVNRAGLTLPEAHGQNGAQN